MEIVALAVVSVPIRPRIACAPVDQIQLRVIHASHPCRRAAGLPTGAFPGVVTGFTRPGDSPDSPAELAGFRVVRVEEAANAEFAARDADDHFVFDGQRR